MGIGAKVVLYIEWYIFPCTVLIVQVANNKFLDKDSRIRVQLRLG